MKQYLKSWFTKENICTRNLHPLLNCVNKLLIFDSGLSHQSDLCSLYLSFPLKLLGETFRSYIKSVEQKENVLLQAALVATSCKTFGHRRSVCSAVLSLASFTIYGKSSVFSVTHSSNFQVLKLDKDDERTQHVRCIAQTLSHC